MHPDFQPSMQALKRAALHTRPEARFAAACPEKGRRAAMRPRCGAVAGMGCATPVT